MATERGREFSRRHRQENSRRLTRQSNIVGTLRSFDQFANIVLENAVERMIVGTHYSDVPLGLYIVRGENVVLMGDIDEAIELKGLTWVENDEIRRMKDHGKWKRTRCTG